MNGRWPSVLKVGSTRLGPRRLIDLLSKAVEAEVHHHGDITLVVIRDRYIYTVREMASAGDAVVVATYDDIAKELIEVLQEDVGAVTRPLVIRALEEEQTSTDGLSYTTADAVRRYFEEAQQSGTSISVSTADVVVQAFDETIDDSVSFEVWSGQILTPSFDEPVVPEDSISTYQAQAVTLTFDETAQTSEAFGTSTASAEVLRFDERQWSDDIPAGYVPQDDEALVIRAFAESVYAHDRVLTSTGPASTPFDISEWYAEYQVMMSSSISEQQSTYDELTLNVVSVQTLTPQETQDSLDTLEYYSTTAGTGAFDISEWYAEYSVT